MSQILNRDCEFNYGAKLAIGIGMHRDVIDDLGRRIAGQSAQQDETCNKLQYSSQFSKIHSVYARQIRKSEADFAEAGSRVNRMIRYYFGRFQLAHIQLPSQVAQRLVAPVRVITLLVAAVANLGCVMTGLYFH